MLRGEPEYHTEVRGGEEWNNRQSVASPRLAFSLPIVIIVFFGLPPNSFWRHISRVSTTATSIVGAIAVAVTVAIVVVAFFETARVIRSIVIITVVVVVVIEAVIFVLIVVVCFCKICRGMGSMSGEWPKRRESRRRDAIMPTRNAARGSRSRATRGYGGHLRGLPELSPCLNLDMPDEVAAGRPVTVSTAWPDTPLGLEGRKGGGSREEATSGSRLYESG